MVIRHNLSAMNAGRQHGIVNETKTKHMEKLSSGYKANRAANGTNGLSDREAMQKEARQLLAEIDRISGTAMFNEKCLFGGPSAGEAPPSPAAPADPAAAVAAYAVPKMGIAAAAYAVPKMARAADAFDGTPDGYEDICGGFRVSGTGYSFAGGVLTISDGANVTVKGTGNPTTDRIVVANGATASITLENVNIDLSSTGDLFTDVTGLAAFMIADNSTGNVTLTLAGANTLKSGVNCAGLQKNGDSPGIGKLAITGSGSLTATGGDSGAGIGGGNWGAGSSIEITGGSVAATSGNWGAGIGGGSYRAGSGIKISGGSVTATGGELGAGIGGGRQGAGSGIEISGGSVAARGGLGAQSIGSGRGDTGSTGNTAGGSAYQPAGKGTTSTIVAGRDGALIIDDKTGTVTGNITLDKDFSIPQDVTLTVGADAVLTVGNGATLTNNGTINNNGTIDVYGRFINNGTLNGNPVTEHNTQGIKRDTQFEERIWIQCGADAGVGMFIEIGAMNTRKLGLHGIDVTTEEGARDAINATGGALAYVSAMRSRIGAQQNRLEHTIANEENILENTTAAESIIRDADMAQEMVAFSIVSILAQAGEAMLAQANTSQQGVLALLGR